jgi:hypothetical protein
MRQDSASTVFVRNFYGFLFQGFSVQRSFNEAVVALRSHSEGQLQAASQHFRLLPETQGTRPVPKLQISAEDTGKICVDGHYMINVVI